MRLRLILALAVACGLASAAGTYLVVRSMRLQTSQARGLDALGADGKLHVVVQPAAPPTEERIRACQSNFHTINTAVQAYFAQNREWPGRVSDMLPNTADFAFTTPVGLKGGQLTNMPVCPFETPTSSKPYNLVAVREDPTDASSPIVGYLTDWHNHWRTGQWRDATEYVP